MPLVSYISAMRLDYNGQPMFYLKLFADFEEIEKRKAFIENYGAASKEKEEEHFDGVARRRTIEERNQSSRYGREGQDDYRRKLLEECPFCPITMINEESLLIASHIKPWAVSDSVERIDPNNGFILSPLYDKLFDRGYITFSDDKRVSISNWLSRQVKERIGIKDNQLLPVPPDVLGAFRGKGGGESEEGCVFADLAFTCGGGFCLDHLRRGLALGSGPDEKVASDFTSVPDPSARRFASVPDPSARHYPSASKK